MGRPYVGVKVMLRMPVVLRDLLDARARRVSSTRSALLRHGADLVLQQPETPDAATPSPEHEGRS